jgi:predicted  nucleic acid-binding Zn-ribbon protein
MSDQEMLQAMSNLLDSKLKEELAPIKTDLSDLKSDVSILKTDISDLKMDMKHVKNQVNVLYNWVDGIDLKVKSVTEILEHTKR